MARLQSTLWVSAYIRRVSQTGAFAAVLRRGDDTAGAIFLKINTLGGNVLLLAPAMPNLDDVSPERKWELRQRAAVEAEIDQYIRREADRDPDLWVVEVEDRTGNDHLLAEERASTHE